MEGAVIGTQKLIHKVKGLNKSLNGKERGEGEGKEKERQE